ncbi:uncharacterized protein METZ01_LOCUS210004, partial [marine metagenome]
MIHTNGPILPPRPRTPQCENVSPRLWTRFLQKVSRN